MQKFFILLLALLWLPLLALPALAHSGGTDGKGGHYNRSTGEYHYHHGHSAHDHYDMDGDGVDDCPYDFEDQTESSSGSASSSFASSSNSTQRSSTSSYQDGIKSGYQNGYDAAVVEYTALLKAAKEESEGKVSWLWLLAPTAPLLFAVVELFLKNDSLKMELQQVQSQKQSAINEKSQANEQEAKNQSLEKKRNELTRELTRQKSIVRNCEAQIDCMEEELKELREYKQSTQQLSLQKENLQHELSQKEDELAVINRSLEQYKKEFHKYYDETAALSRKAFLLERKNERLIETVKRRGLYKYIEKDLENDGPE